MIDKSIVRKRFNRHASEYDRYAMVQKEMADKLVEQLAEQLTRPDRLPVDSPSRILEIGSGTGYLTEKLAAMWPQAHIDAVDLSEAMVEEAQTRLGRSASRCRFIVGDAERWAEETLSEPGSRGNEDRGIYDIIVSNATFQWFVDPEQTTKRLLRLLQRGGVFAFSTFGPRTFHELHESFRLAEAELGLPHLPHGQTFIPHTAWQQWLCESTVIHKSERYARVMKYRSVREFLDHVRRIGAGNASTLPDGQRTGGANKALFRLMFERYGERFGDDTGIRATYDIFLFVCKKRS